MKKVIENFVIPEMPDYWPFRLMYDVFNEPENSDLYIKANIIGIFEAINTLPDREKKIILMRYENKMSYSKIGKSLNLSGSRILVIYNTAIRKLRHPSRSKMMLGVSIKEYNKVLNENHRLKCTSDDIINETDIRDIG